MKEIFYIILAILVSVSCVSKNKVTDDNQTRQDCPEDGNCFLEIIPNAKLIIQKDEYGNTFPELQNSEKDLILKFEYRKKVHPKIADGNYKEIIYIQLNKEVNQLSLNNMSLKKANVTYGRLCNCRGTTGFYEINQGELKLLKTNRGYNVSLKFKINEVPQTITAINKSFNY